MARKKLKEFKKNGLPNDVIKEMVSSVLHIIGFVGDVVDKDVSTIMKLFPQIKYIPLNIASLICLLRTVKYDDACVLDEDGVAVSIPEFKQLLVDAQSCAVRENSILHKIISMEQYKKIQKNIPMVIGYFIVQKGGGFE